MGKARLLYFNSRQCYWFEQKWYKRVLILCHFVIFLRDPESQADDDSQEIFKLAKDVLIQGLTDENLGLQYVLAPPGIIGPGPINLGVFLS